MKTVAAIPASRAAHATAWPWLPALAATTPALRSSDVREWIVLTAPRILKAPVRCRFSAFNWIVRPASRDSVSEGYTGVTRAIPSMRPASRLDVGERRGCRPGLHARPVLVLDPVHVLEDLTDGRERVELAGLDAGEQLRELGLLRHRRLQVRLRPARRRGEHLAGQVLPPPLLEQSLRLEEASVLLDLGPELGNVLASHGLRQDDRRSPRALAVEREDRADLVQHRLRGGVIHLVDGDDVGDLHDPRFQCLDGVAGAGHQHQQHRIRDPDHLDLALAGADRLEQDDVLAGRVEQERRLQRSPPRARRGGRASPSSG